MSGPNGMMYMSVCVCACALSCVRLFTTSVCGICQTRILSGLLFPSPGDLPDPGIEPASLVSPALARAGSLPIEPSEMYMRACFKLDKCKELP